MLRRSFCASVFVWAVIAALPLAAKDASGFTGRWTLDPSTSPSASMAPPELTEKITQKGNDLLIQSQWREPKNGMYALTLVGITTTEFRLPVDGSDSESQVGPFAMKTKSTMDANTLTTDWTATSGGQSMQGKWIRTLSEDGKRMTLEVHGKDASGADSTATLVFKRK